MKPFLKWPGNKYRIIDRIQKVLPRGERLIEPFVGSGAVFLNTDFDEYLLADSNNDLINLFNLVKQEGMEFIAYTKEYFKGNNTEKRFYELREIFNSINDVVKKSAIFLYLNKHAYNGLCRYNKSGKFNAPFGRYKSPYFPFRELKYFLAKSSQATFIVSDFRETMSKAVDGDVLYCDPPYVPLSKTSNFTTYSAGGFGQNEQSELAGLAKKLSKRNIPVVISNHATEYTCNAYRSAKVDSFDVRRFISCKGSERNKVKELIAIFS